MIGDSKVKISLAALVGLANQSLRIRLHPVHYHAQQSGGYLSRFKGRGMEFEEARIYQPGDDIRNIDWRVTARTGKAHTKVFREEREKPVFIAVDDRAAMHFATRGQFKSVLAAKLAGLLAWTAEQQGDRIGGQLFSETFCRELKPQNGRRAVLRLFDLLVKGRQNQPHSPAHPQFALAEVLARLAQHARPGSSVYLISDFRGLDHAAENQLTRLADHCDVVLLFVYDGLEQSLPNQQGRYRFTDALREIVLDGGDSQTQRKYQQQFILRRQRLEQLAQKRGLRLLQCATTDDPTTCLR